MLCDSISHTFLVSTATATSPATGLCTYPRRFASHRCSVYHDGGAARFHIDTLGAKGLFYSDADSLVKILLNFDRTQAGAQPGARDWNAYRGFAPEKVMQVFKRVFLEGGAVHPVRERMFAGAKDGQKDV